MPERKQQVLLNSDVAADAGEVFAAGDTKPGQPMIKTGFHQEWKPIA
jgi:hypothetical protein